jgi:prolyl-tRNA synthetase
MLQRASQLHLPTLREDPAEAESASHVLSVRAGLVRQVGAGLYSFLPVGWRIHQRIVQIVREEMNAIGGQEMLMPLLTPADLWRRTGRYDSTEVFKLTGRGDREYVLALSHEETITTHARELSSYKQLPQIWYHFGTKGRDEPRPRSGLLRVREFVMKDSYSFDRDEEGLEESYRKHDEAYRRIFDRCGLEYHVSESDVGLMGGSAAHEYLAPAAVGENEVAVCSSCDYAANVEVATGTAAAPEFGERHAAPREVETPGVTTIDALAQFLSIDPRTTSKAMPVVRESDGALVLGLVRGDHRLHDLKLAKALGSAFRPAHPEEIRESFGADGGSLGPVGVELEIVADEALREGQYVVGANRNGWHLLGVEAGRDYEPRFADLRAVESGDGCPRCGGSLRVEPAIEVGNIFKLGTRYSVPLEATFLDESGRERPLVMGSYGIGPARTLAAVIEQHHDEQGITWPASVAPYHAHVVVLPGLEEQGAAVAEALAAGGEDVLLDDRDLRAGEKFADADLLGCPTRVTVGKKTLEDGAVDVRDRATGAERRVPLAELGALP